MTLKQKVKEAETLIIKAHNRHKNGLYIGVSGGKDSQVLLKIARKLFPSMLAIHNEHTGEKLGKLKGILIVKSPKKTNVPKFLKSVKLTAQLDGTRKDEDKTVIVNGKEIHRHKMRSYSTKKGVWGLEVYFPLINFSEKEIYEYLRKK